MIRRKRPLASSATMTTLAHSVMVCSMESVGKSGRPLYTKESLKRGSGMGEPQCTSEVELSLIQSGRKDSNCSRRKLIVNQKPGLETVSQLLIITLRKQIKVSSIRHLIDSWL